MRKLASLLLAASAAGSLLAPATSAAAIGYPPRAPSSRSSSWAPAR